MAFNHTLSAILRGRWLIDKQWANDHLPLVLLMLKGQPVSFVDRTGNEGVELPFIIDPATMQRQPMYAYVPDKGYVPNPNLAPNSVGVIPMSGPMTKYNGDCGEPGMIQRTTWLMDMQRRNNVGSIIQMMDTPGGESRAASTYVSVLNRSNKPVLSYVDGMCASLGMWFASSSDEVYLSNELDEMGSIGSYCTLLDFRGYLEKEGIKLIEIYAPQSTDKNKDYAMH
jgi:protease-4